MINNMYFFFDKDQRFTKYDHIATYPVESTPDPFLPGDPPEQIVIRVPEADVRHLYRLTNSDQTAGVSDWLVKLRERDPEYPGQDRYGIITTEWDESLEIDSDRYLGEYAKAIERQIVKVLSIGNKRQVDRVEFGLQYDRLARWLAVSDDAGLVKAEHIRLTKEIEKLVSQCNQRGLVRADRQEQEMVAA